MINPADNPYVYAEVRGTATLTPDRERALPDRLSKKYTGRSYADFNPAAENDDERVVVRVTPTKITGRM